MRNFIWPLALLLFSSACGRPAQLSGPAPAGALSCARAHGEAAGYEVVAGSVENDFLRLVQRIPPPPAEGATAEPPPDLGDVVIADPGPDLIENELLIEQARGRINITVLGISETGIPMGAASSAEEQARTILALCTTAPPVLPE